MSQVKQELREPISCYVQEKYLYNLNEEYEKLIPCRLVSICSYKSHQLTFDILLDSGEQFCYLPFKAFRFNSEINEMNKMELHDTISKVLCPSHLFIINTIKIFKNKVPLVYDHKRELFSSTGNEYFFSLEWYTQNELVHVFKMVDRIYYVPNHKIIWAKKGIETPPKLKNYKALKYEWK